MKTLNDFKNENKDLDKLEMATKIGGVADPVVTREITGEKDSNWNCGDVETCTLVATGVAVAQPPFFKNKIVNYKKTTSFKLI